jgi:hypothetical protein
MYVSLPSESNGAAVVDLTYRSQPAERIGVVITIVAALGLLWFVLGLPLPSLPHRRRLSAGVASELVRE